MSVKRFYDFPDGSGNLSNDDIFLFMDDPSGSGITKKISLLEISNSIGENSFDQDLNTFNSVTFDEITISGSGTASYYVMVNVDGNTVTSSDGLNWNGPYDLNIATEHVATDGNTIVVIDDDLMGYTSFSNPSSITPITPTVSGIANIDLNQIIYGGGYFVVAGEGNDGIKDVAVYGYSSDSSNWTFKVVEGELADILADNNNENCRFSDIDYNGTGWNFAVEATNVGGGVYTTDITETFTSSNYFPMVPGQQVAWNGSSWYYINDDIGSGFNTNTDPRIGQWDGPYNPWASAQEDLGINTNSNISDTFCGGNGYLAFSDSDGHVSFSNDNGQNWTYVTPIPYTATITNIAYVDNKYQLTITGIYTSHDDGEKITISGSSVSGYNGTYYLDDENFLYTDYQLTIPWTSEIDPFSGTANLTWSHGTYIDAMDYVNGYFYIGNDDEQIARSSNLTTWTIVDDRNNAFEYWHDFNGYVSEGNGGIIINGDQIIFTDGSIQNSATFKIANIDLHNGGLQSSQVLQFNDISKQSVITGPVPASGNNAQRIIVQGQRGQGNGEGGDVYLWGGDADTNGGDIKIYAGDADNIFPDNGYGGYVNIDGGKGTTNGGNVEITAGYSEGGQAGYVSIIGGPTSTGVAGNVTIQTNNNNTKTWTFDTNGDLNIPGNIILPNYTTVATGTFDNGTGGNGGISLNCIIGYELNWQGGHLKSTLNNGENTYNILFDSAIEFPGSGVDNVEVNSTGITFSDGTTQTSAGIPSNTGLVPNSTSITNIVSISQANYDAIVTKDSSTLYVIS